MSDLRQRPGDQPLPVPNEQPSIQSMVRADLDSREQVGVQRYGTPLQPHNGRDAMRDAYEEALDLTCYLRQVIAERLQQASEGRSVAVMADGITDEVRRAGWEAFQAAISGGYDATQVYGQTLEAIIDAYVKPSQRIAEAVARLAEAGQVTSARKLLHDNSRMTWEEVVAYVDRLGVAGGVL